MSKSKLKVAIIGTGRMGGLMEDENPFRNQYTKPYGHFSSYMAIPEVEVVAVANRGRERLERFSKRFDFENTYLDYKEMIEKEKPDIVSVTTPSVRRAEPIIFAAENGVKGIYAEKGLCASLEEADNIRDAVEKNKVAFNWGASRRHHSGWVQLAEGISKGAIGEPLFATMYTFTDIIKHHPHTLDTVSMLLGDPLAKWVEGSLVEKGDQLENGAAIERPRAFPDYDRENHRFVPPSGEEIADPMVGFYRVGYSNGSEGLFVPTPGRWEIDVQGTEGRAWGWEQQGIWKIRKGGQKIQRNSKKSEKPPLIEDINIRLYGDSPTVNTIRDIINEINTGERTRGNIDVTMQSVEVQFGIANSHLQGGKRVSIPVSDRSLYIPGG